MALEQNLLTVWTFICLMCGWSYIFKETDFFHFVEYTIVGSMTAFAFNSAFWFLVTNGLTPILEGQFVYILGFILGALMYAQFSTRFSWIMRYPLGIMAGTYIGLSIRGIIAASIVDQIVGTISPLFSSTSTPIDTLNQILIVIICVAVIWHFIFSERLSFYPKPYKYVSIIGRIGIVTVMAFFLGYYFVGGIMMVFISRVEFIIRDFLGMFLPFLRA